MAALDSNKFYSNPTGQLKIKIVEKIGINTYRQGLYGTHR
jgi:hypothetical protein